MGVATAARCQRHAGCPCFFLSCFHRSSSHWLLHGGDKLRTCQVELKILERQKVWRTRQLRMWKMRWRRSLLMDMAMERKISGIMSRTIPLTLSKKLENRGLV